MGFGKMLAGLFKKDEAEVVQTDRSNSGDGPAEDTGQEHMDSTGVIGDPVSVESAGLHGDAGHERAYQTPADVGANEASSADSAHAEVTENKILEVLSNVYDPEIPIDIVNLGLIYGIDIEGGNVHITMTMTAPGCPASTQIAGESKILVEEIPGVENVDIELVWDPPWDPSKMSDDAQQSMGIF
ncbi:MAG: metal-sulfur cluster assembly factor [Candidatus Dadabacteria bacterium]|nr:metal-sulfur cluster assembly factor [Candidatus Dadabacteria bacterium]